MLTEASSKADAVGAEASLAKIAPRSHSSFRVVILAVESCLTEITFLHFVLLKTGGLKSHDVHRDCTESVRGWQGLTRVGV